MLPYLFSRSLAPRRIARTNVFLIVFLGVKFYPRIYEQRKSFCSGSKVPPKRLSRNTSFSYILLGIKFHRPRRRCRGVAEARASREKSARLNPKLVSAVEMLCFAVFFED